MSSRIEIPCASDRRIQELIAINADQLYKKYAEGRHQIASVLMCRSGRKFFGVHLEAMVGRASICAEAVALGNAVLRDDIAFEDDPVALVVSLRFPKSTEVQEARVVPPCGLCRELLADYAPTARVAVPTVSDVAAMRLSTLLPHKYVGTKWD